MFSRRNPPSPPPDDKKTGFGFPRGLGRAADSQLDAKAEQRPTATRSVAPQPEVQKDSGERLPPAGREAGASLAALVQREVELASRPAVAATLPPPIAPVRKPGITAPAQSAAVGKTITSLDQLGQYAYYTEANDSLNPAWKPMFGVVRTEDKAITLLIEVDAASRPVRWEVGRRIRDAGTEITRTVVVTADVIAKLHQVHSSSSRAAVTRGPVDDTYAEKRYKEIVKEAIDRKASDIHIETRGTHADIIFRVHGVRVSFDSVSFDTAMAMCNVMYTVHADATSKETAWSADKVLDTSLDYLHPNGTRAVLRFSSSPIYPKGNIHAVIRIAIMDETERTIEGLGYTENQLDAVRRMLLGSSGLVLTTGPTNSGKSTLLQGVIGTVFQIRGPMTKVITVEDPVENVIKGACQIGVSRGRTGQGEAASDDSAFTRYLKGVLRQDPDVVMVGEIRDVDTAAVSKDLVLAGRKVFSTLHTYSAMDAFSRLIELEVPRALLTTKGFLSGIIYQRLVAKLCPHCSLPLHEGGRERLDRALYDRLTRVVESARAQIRVRGDGCSHCNNFGYVGRLPVCEIILPDQQLLQLIGEGKTSAARLHWREHCGVQAFDPDGKRLGVTALAHALARMLRGEVDPSDVESSVSSLDADLNEEQSVVQPEFGGPFGRREGLRPPAEFGPPLRTPRGFGDSGFFGGELQ